jgi:hypothetical protein
MTVALPYQRMNNFPEELRGQTEFYSSSSQLGDTIRKAILVLLPTSRIFSSNQQVQEFLSAHHTYKDFFPLTIYWNPSRSHVTDIFSSALSKK